MFIKDSALIAIDSIIRLLPMGKVKNVLTKCFLGAHVG